MIDHNKLVDINWLREQEADPYFFGLGFIQLKLTHEERIHFYHPELTSKMPDEEVHNHRYDFHSSVLRGNLQQSLFRFVEDVDGDMISTITSCDPNNPAPAVVKYGNLLHQLDFVTPAGFDYVMSRHSFHKVVDAELAVTHLTRYEPFDDFATVIRKRNVVSVCPFSFELPQKRIWELIDECLNGVYNGYHRQNINKGTIGDISKIVEEMQELVDAHEQGIKIMQLCELSDMYGAMCLYLEKHHPNTTIGDVISMSDATRRAFENGHRTS